MFDDLDFLSDAGGGGFGGTHAILSQGSNGADVQTWTQFLVSKGLLASASGVFTADVAAATVRYQQTNGLISGGVVDNATWAKAESQGLSAVSAPAATPQWQAGVSKGMEWGGQALSDILRIVQIGLIAEAQNGQVSPQLAALQQQLAVVQGGGQVSPDQLAAMQQQALEYEAQKKRADTYKTVGIVSGIIVAVGGLFVILVRSVGGVRRGRGARRSQRRAA